MKAMSEEIVLIDIDKITPYPNNPRKNDNAVEAVKRSIEKYGFRAPILVDKDKVIIAGHTRYEASQRIGLTEVPCVIAGDLTEDEVKELRIIDNKTSELAVWNYFKLATEIASLDVEFEDFGFTDVEIESLEGLAGDIGDVREAVYGETGQSLYTPVTEPKSSGKVVTDDDIMKAKEKMRQGIIDSGKQERNAIICPYCGERIEYVPDGE